MRKRSKRFSGKAIREALKRTRGNVSLAATMLGCSRETIYQHTTADERKAIKDEAYSDLVDMAETMLTQAVKRGEKWAVQFTLERMGRERGWGNATQIEHAGQINVSHEARPVLDTAAIVQELKSMFGPAGEDLPDTFELTDD